MSSTASLVGDIQARRIILNVSLQGTAQIGSTSAFDGGLQYKHVDI